ncbi:histone deacetylase family protein [Propionivibrio sp.]|uniref:histone deacetylase family protein n=1 Tax=Propionivibrio sp. TaxID=2212460 RepID=UPI003BF38F8C
MRVVFHEAFHDSSYSEDKYDNAAEPGRLLGIMAALRDEGGYGVNEPEPATRDDLLRGHSETYVADVESKPRLFAMASLATGAAILASDLAMRGEPAFACVRPPGHHASRSSAWGHCTFSNVALALLWLRDTGLIRSALVVDFDQHTGNGTQDVLKGWPEAQVFNPYGDNAADYLRTLDEGLQHAPQVDILAVSAGFDGYIHDLGRKLATEDYFTIGRLLQAYAIRLGHQHRFAVLEGGYYLPDLGKNALAFCRGFE